MEVRHNTSLLERAVELSVQRAAIPTQRAEAEAFKKRAEASAHRRLYTGVAIGVASLGIGLGIMFGLWRPPAWPQLAQQPPGRSTVEQGPAQSGRGIEPFPERRDANPLPLPPGQTRGPVTVDFTKFASQTVAFQGRSWILTAGHQYEKDTDPTWKSAWCYTFPPNDTVSVQVELAARASPMGPPQAPIASQATLARAELDEASAIALATKCPWIDKNTFRVEDIRVPSDRSASSVEGGPIFEMNGRTLTFRGPIEGNFAEEIKRRNFDRLLISSRGGIVVQAIAAGDWLRANGKTVEVSQHCLSACPLVLAGGVLRTAAATARIGIHRFYTRSEQANLKSVDIGQMLSSEILRYLDRMGIDQALFHTMARVPSDDMAYIDHATLRTWRLLGGSDPSVLVPLPPPRDVASLPPVAVPPQPFAAKDGFDAMGHDLPDMPLRDISQSGCEERCRGNPLCMAFVFNKRFNVCFLKGNATLLFADDMAFAGYRIDRNVTPKMTRLKARGRRIYQGEQLRQFDAVSFDTCASQCDGNSECKAFNYDPGLRACTLMRTTSGEVERLGSFSGSKIGG